MTGAAATIGSLRTTALKPFKPSAVYSTVRLVPSESIKEYAPLTTLPIRVST